MKKIFLILSKIVILTFAVFSSQLLTLFIQHYEATGLLPQLFAGQKENLRQQENFLLSVAFYVLPAVVSIVLVRKYKISVFLGVVAATQIALYISEFYRIISISLPISDYKNSLITLFLTHFVVVLFLAWLLKKYIFIAKKKRKATK